jgi:hypothetical protein
MIFAGYSLVPLGCTFAFIGDLIFLNGTVMRR